MSLPSLTLIPAGAGSGKTFTIQQTLAKWVRDDLVDADKIVAVTFTEAAAGELRERIRNQLVADGRLEDALRLDQAYISTIHGFGLRLLTEFAFDGGSSPTPRLLNEDEEAILIRLALAETDRADRVMYDLERHGYKYDFNSRKSGEDIFRERVLNLVGKLRSIGRAKEDAQLIPHALQKITNLYGPTDLAEHLNRALHRSVEALLGSFPQDLSRLYPDNNAFVTALRKNYQQLKKAQRLEAVAEDWSLWQGLRDLRLSKRGTALPADYDDLAQAVMDAAEALPRHPGPLAQALAHVEALLGAAQDCLGRYAAKKRSKGLVDYTDMLALSRDLLVRRGDILATLRKRVACLVIDEFQDTNPLQFSLLWALHQAGVPTLIVGDLKQAIMGFQNADARLMAALEAQNPDHIEPLTNNWRSTPALMSWVNALGRGLFGAQYTELAPRADYPSRLAPLEVMDFAENWAARAGQSESPGLVRPRSTVARLKALLDDPTQIVFDRHRKISRPLRAGDIAILCPTNARLDAYAEALRDLGLRSRREQDGWYESPVVRIARHALAYVADPADQHSALVLSVTEIGRENLQSALQDLLDGRGLSDPVIDALQTVMEGSPDRAVSTLVGEVVEALDLYGIVATWPEAEQARADLLRLEGEAREFLTSNREALASGGYYGTGLKSFLAWLQAKAERHNGRPDPRVVDEDAVVLMTWHKSKGKEWPVVVVAGADSEVKCPLPSIDISYADFSDLEHIVAQARMEISPDFVAPESKEKFIQPLWESARESALRLLYVVLARAREKVILEWPRYLDNGKERKTTTFWEVLVEATGMRLEDKSLRIDGQSFDCRVIQTDRFSPEEYEQATSAQTLLPVIGRRALEAQPLPAQTTPEMVTPSTLKVEPAPLAVATMVIHYAAPLHIDLPLAANEKGLLLHRCFEIMDGKRDRTLINRLLGLDLTEQQYREVATAVESFQICLQREFDPIGWQSEVPILTLNEQGSVVTGYIDLLVETGEGWWIIDHKSDQVEDLEEGFSRYLPQLGAYAEALARAAGDKPVLGVGIHWISRGCCQIMVGDQD
ncbi:UvrD-helicase domain-containing protein [Geoalkalibacter halelectricus]|uniref:UvrD-helicase domain-containing protein n=1 Tax=Geoalkalibacter halelectricus TaxID=2847045 RepID=UPI003D249F07